MEASSIFQPWGMNTPNVRDMALPSSVDPVRPRRAASLVLAVAVVGGLQRRPIPPRSATTSRPASTTHRAVGHGPADHHDDRRRCPPPVPVAWTSLWRRASSARTVAVPDRLRRPRRVRRSSWPCVRNPADDPARAHRHPAREPGRPRRVGRAAGGPRLPGEPGGRRPLRHRRVRPTGGRRQHPDHLRSRPSPAFRAVDLDPDTPERGQPRWRPRHGRWPTSARHRGRPARPPRHR